MKRRGEIRVREGGIVYWSDSALDSAHFYYDSS